MDDAVHGRTLRIQGDGDLVGLMSDMQALADEVMQQPVPLAGRYNMLGRPQPGGRFQRELGAKIRWTLKRNGFDLCDGTQLRMYLDEVFRLTVWTEALDARAGKDGG